MPSWSGPAQNLLACVHSGFSVHVGPALLADDRDRLEYVARTITWAPMRVDALEHTAEAMVVQTPLDPRTGKRQLRLDPLDLIHCLCQQISAPGQHLVRYYGHYASRTRGARRERAAGAQTAVRRRACGLKDSRA